MRRYGYTLAFVAVLLVACVGGFLGGRFLLARLQQDLGPQAGWTPAAPTPEALVTRQTSAPVARVTPSGTPPRPAATLLALPATPAPVDVPAASTASPTPTPFATEALTPSSTTLVSPTPAPAFPYALARPVRHSAGDCPGTYILGQVTDRAGNPLPDVRLYLVDQFGNGATAVSKAGAADAGRYDFPIGGPARRFFLTIIDADGRQLSPRVEIGHGLAPDPQASCHWADWRRQ